MSKSQLETALAQQLDLAARDASGRWPFPAPRYEYRFDEGCCHHSRKTHKTRGRMRYLWCEGCRLAERMVEEGMAAPARTHEAAHTYVAPRRWRLDTAWPTLQVACEVEGGIYVGGRHTRGRGFEADLEKYARAMELGWNVVRVSERMIATGEALRLIEVALQQASERALKAAAK